MNKHKKTMVLVRVVSAFGIFALVSSCIAGIAKAQGVAESRRQLPADALTHINSAELVIHKSHPEITQATLNQDKAEIGTAFPKVWVGSDASLSDGETANLLATVWKDYRDSDPRAQLDAPKVTALANGYGGLRVTTTPSGAKIWVDGKLWDGTTEQTCFTRSGARKVKVGGLENYNDEEASVTVVATRVIVFSRTLKRK
jgi:hypothetical protein